MDVIESRGSDDDHVAAHNDANKADHEDCMKADGMEIDNGGGGGGGDDDDGVNKKERVSTSSATSVSSDESHFGKSVGGSPSSVSLNFVFPI